DLKIKNKIYNRFDSYRKSLVNTYVDKSGMKMESDIDHGHEFVRIGLKKGSLSLYHLISMIYNNFRNDDIENFIPETVSGFNINNPQKGCQNISIRGSFLHSLNYNPIVVINDVPYYNYYNRHKISSILPNKIESIRIIKGNIATGKYGSPATNGVIEIKTDVGNTWGRNSFRLKRPKRIAYHKFYGEREDRNYSETRQFYIPVYDNKNDTSCIRNDFRQTIYWNPIIQTDENGKAKISFYNSDAITSFKIIAEGIGYTGIPGRKEETYNIQKPLSIDVKVPAYLSVGDTLEIPITVSNNTDNIISAAFALNLPEELKTIGNVPTTIKIAPNNISAKFIKILPVKACSSSNILIGIRSLEFEDIFSKEVSIRKFEEEK
ncbi:MAG: TonB-dependent receptor plug domain-containing protein, partial [bacterium]|nr:TonB-dependent receptor plug domain-containing protein [bacterium]